MTTFKMPETPVPIPTPSGGRIFTKDQVDGHGKQCAAYALMRAAQVCIDHQYEFADGNSYAKAIRAMIKEIPE